MISDTFKEVSARWKIVEIVSSLSDDFGKIAGNCHTTISDPFREMSDSREILVIMTGLSGDVEQMWGDCRMTIGGF